MLYAICLIVGFLVGGTGVGGILVPPALVLLSGLDAHIAMGTALASFPPLGVLGTYMYFKMGHIDLKKALPYLAGGLLGAAPGALFNARISSAYLIILLGSLIIFAGFCALFPPGKNKRINLKINLSHFWQSKIGFFIIGLITGILAGLTGAGGPVLSIPWMIAVGVSPMAAVGMSYPYQIATSFSGTFGNLFGGNVDFHILPLLCIWQFVGFYLGAKMAQKLPSAIIKTSIGCLCCLLGAFLIFREIIKTM